MLPPHVVQVSLAHVDTTLQGTLTSVCHFRVPCAISSLLPRKSPRWEQPGSLPVAHIYFSLYKDGPFVYFTFSMICFSVKHFLFRNANFSLSLCLLVCFFNFIIACMMLG